MPNASFNHRRSLLVLNQSLRVNWHWIDHFSIFYHRTESTTDIVNVPMDVHACPSVVSTKPCRGPPKLCSLTLKTKKHVMRRVSIPGGTHKESVCDNFATLHFFFYCHRLLEISTGYLASVFFSSNSNRFIQTASVPIKSSAHPHKDHHSTVRARSLLTSP